MGRVRQLPAHRYRMNALLGRTGGRLRDYQRTCDRLWADARNIESNQLVRRDDGQLHSVRTVTVQAGPARGPFFVSLAIEPGLSLVDLRFDAQRITLDAAVDASPSYWGASAGIDVDSDELSDGELERLFAAVLAENVPPGSFLSPWCGAAALLQGRLPLRLPRWERQHRSLRMWRAARRGRILAPGSFLVLQIRAAVRAWWAERRDGAAGRCRIALVGQDAPAIARALMGSTVASGPVLEVCRVADASFVYSPATDFSPARDARQLVATGSFDEGILTEPCDVLALLPGAPPISRESAALVGAALVLELAPGAMSPEADGTLSGRRIYVLPDLLFSAAAVIACRALVERGRRSGIPASKRLSFELARLAREVLRDAADRGRSVREQLYLRALANLRG